MIHEKYINPRSCEPHDSKNNTENGKKSQTLKKQVSLPGLTTAQMPLQYWATVTLSNKFKLLRACFIYTEVTAELAVATSAAVQSGKAALHCALACLEVKAHQHSLNVRGSPKVKDS